MSQRENATRAILQSMATEGLGGWHALSTVLSDTADVPRDLNLFTHMQSLVGEGLVREVSKGKWEITAAGRAKATDAP